MSSQPFGARHPLSAGLDVGLRVRLAGLLSLCRRQRLADGERCLRGERAALHVADLCAVEVR